MFSWFFFAFLCSGVEEDEMGTGFWILNGFWDTSTCLVHT